MASPFAAETTDAVLRLPPGLEPPPGLELPCEPRKVLAPPGLEKSKRAPKPKKNKADAAPMYILPEATGMPCPPAFGVNVRISSLPNHLLNKAMMTATLEQARLDTFVSGIMTKPGAQRGEALITFTNPKAAVQCARHFHGRRWDASGSLVTAQLLPVAHPVPPSSLAPVSVPMPSFRLSAEAAEFVPGGAQPVRASVKEMRAIGSDESTADGDSNASSDEKDVAA